MRRDEDPNCGDVVLAMPMKPTKYKTYQDYVIRDGNLVGEFEEMYRDFDDPWGQTTNESAALDKFIGLALLKKHGHRRPLEYGCGLGHYTNLLYRELGAGAGLDISETAIAKARRLYPSPTFYVGDILLLEPLAEFKPDVLIFSQITWYVLDKLAKFKALLATSRGGCFLHLLEVYPEGRQAYGRDYFVDLKGILNYWSEVIDIQEWGEVCRREDEGGGRTFLYGKIK